MTNFNSRLLSLMNEYGFNQNMIYQWYLWEINIFRAWEEFGYGNNDIKVAILDNDFQLDHPFIKENIYLAKDFKEIYKPEDKPDIIVDGIAYRDGRVVHPEPFQPNSNSSHGNAVATVIGGELDKLAGVSPSVKLIIIRPDVDDSNNDDNGWIDAFQYAANNGANVICCALGYHENMVSLREEISQKIYELSESMVFCFASGNAYYNNITEKYENEGALGFAAHEKIISVGSCTINNELAKYSMKNENTFITAPSDGDGLSIIAADLIGAAGSTNFDHRYNFGGTSAACPIVSGIIVLMLSQNPDLKVEEIKDIFYNNCIQIDSQHFKIDAYAVVKEAHNQNSIV